MRSGNECFCRFTTLPKWRLPSREQNSYVVTSIKRIRNDELFVSFLRVQSQRNVRSLEVGRIYLITGKNLFAPCSGGERCRSLGKKLREQTTCTVVFEQFRCAGRKETKTKPYFRKWPVEPPTIIKS